MAKMELRGTPRVRGREKKMQQRYLQDAGAASEVNVVSESQRNVLKEVEWDEKWHWILQHGGDF